MLKEHLQAAFQPYLADFKVPEDAPLIKALRQPGGPEPHHLDAMTTWMRQYSLFQGIDTHTRTALAEKALDILPHLSWPATEREAAVHELFTLVFGALYNISPRGWISATSKLLWLRFPEHFVIYDSFVERAVIVLQWLEPSVQCFNDRLGSPPSGLGIGTKAENRQEEFRRASASFYLRYQSMVWAMYQHYKPDLEALSAAHPNPDRSPYSIRLFDRFLLHLGSP